MFNVFAKIFSKLATTGAVGANIAGSAARGSEGALTFASNLLLPFSKRAKTGQEALKKIFPHFNSTVDRAVNHGNLSKLVKPDFLEKNGFKGSGMKGHGPAFTHHDISMDDLMQNAVNRDAKKKLSGMKLGHVGVGGGARRVVMETVADERKFALNANIVRNVAIGATVYSSSKGLVQGIGYQPSDPTVYYDGTNIRQINDMGANARYGQAVMGRRR